MEPPQPHQNPPSPLGDRYVQWMVIGVCLMVIGLAIQTPRQPESDQKATEPLSLKLDPNTADQFELAVLPRVGPSMARRIVEDRMQNGPFKKTSDLLRIPGIGPKTLSNMESYLVIP